VSVRLKAALTALITVLLITFACLAFMPWRMDSVVTEIGDIQKCVILCYESGTYTCAYPEEENLDRLTEKLSVTTGHFDRKRSEFSYPAGKPLYRVYFWDSEGRIPDLWICDTALSYDEAQFVLDDAAAASLNEILASCFE